MVLFGPLFHEFAQLLVESCLVTGSSGCGKLLGEILGPLHYPVSPDIAGPSPAAWVPPGLGAGWVGCLEAPGLGWERSGWAEQGEQCTSTWTCG